MTALGYKIGTICEALGLNRSSYYYKLQDKKSFGDEEIVKRIKAILEKHPYWGYPRVTNWLKRREGVNINKKKTYRLMQENDLLNKNKRCKATRVVNTSKPRPDKPNQWWGTDMTKFLIPDVGWAYLVIVKDWFTKKCIGWHVDLFSRSAEWLKALNMAVLNQCPNGSRGMNIHLMSDNGSQPTSRAYMSACSLLEIKQAFTSYNNPKGNADTERFIRTIKEECIWLHEFSSLQEAREKIKISLEEYNSVYVHSALDGMSPIEFEQKWLEEQEELKKLLELVDKIALDKRSFTENSVSVENSAEIPAHAA